MQCKIIYFHGLISGKLFIVFHICEFTGAMGMSIKILLLGPVFKKKYYSDRLLSFS